LSEYHKDIEVGNKKFLESIETKNTIYQKLRVTTKAVLRRKFIVMSTYIKKKKNHRDLK
jgi:hypothetical protein